MILRGVLIVVGLHSIQPVQTLRARYSCAPYLVRSHQDFFMAVYKKDLQVKRFPLLRKSQDQDHYREIAAKAE